jgi:hypothetical protein
MLCGVFSALLTLDDDFARFGCLVLRQGQPQHAILVLRLDLVRVYQGGKPDDADELAERPLLSNPHGPGHLRRRSLPLHCQLIPLGDCHFQLRTYPVNR